MGLVIVIYKTPFFMVCLFTSFDYLHNNYKLKLIMEWYLKVMRDNYANFSGRARRKEYWMFYLIYLLIMILLMVIDNILGLTFEVSGQNLGYGWLYLIGGFAHFIPLFSVNIRRLHDVGKSGWFFLIGLIPILGAIWLLVLACTEGNKFENKWGPDSKPQIIKAS